MLDAAPTKLSKCNMLDVAEKNHFPDISMRLIDCHILAKLFPIKHIFTVNN
jgi:hypothetical protein